MPFEGELRGWLRRRTADSADVEDVVQDCYCRLARLGSVEHITQPRAYLFAMASHFLLRKIRRAQVVRLEAIADLDTGGWASDAPSPEQVVIARHELERVRAAIAMMPERARRILEMRRVEGLPQKDVARTLRITEEIVENEARRGLRALLKLLSSPTGDETRTDRGHDDARARRRR
jgi:RNA polymerase sigma factor (sigma-70 family)